jgi:hypothetical protein
MYGESPARSSPVERLRLWVWVRSSQVAIGRWSKMEIRYLKIQNACIEHEWYC